MLNVIRSSRHFSVWGLLALLLSLALPCNAIAQSKPLKHIYIGVSSVSMGNIIIYVAKEAKLYEKYGLYADPVAMRGSGESSKAMIIAFGFGARDLARRASAAGRARAQSR